MLILTSIEVTFLLQIALIDYDPVQMVLGSIIPSYLIILFVLSKLMACNISQALTESDSQK